MGHGASIPFDSIAKKLDPDNLFAYLIKHKFDNKYVNKLDVNTVYWLALAHLVCTRSGSVAEYHSSKQVRYFPEKDPNRPFTELLGMPFFEDDESVHRKEVDDKLFDLSVLFQKKLIEKVNLEKLVDSTFFFKSNNDVKIALVEVFGTGMLPECTVQWNYWNNVHTFTNLAFSGLGQCKFNSILLFLLRD